MCQIDQEEKFPVCAHLLLVDPLLVVTAEGKRYRLLFGTLGLAELGRQSLVLFLHGGHFSEGGLLYRLVISIR